MSQIHVEQQFIYYTDLHKTFLLLSRWLRTVFACLEMTLFALFSVFQAAMATPLSYELNRCGGVNCIRIKSDFEDGWGPQARPGGSQKRAFCLRDRSQEENNLSQPVRSTDGSALLPPSGRTDPRWHKRTCPLNLHVNYEHSSFHLSLFVLQFAFLPVDSRSVHILFTAFIITVWFGLLAVEEIKAHARFIYVWQFDT